MVHVSLIGRAGWLQFVKAVTSEHVEANFDGSNVGQKENLQCCGSARIRFWAVDCLRKTASCMIFGLTLNGISKYQDCFRFAFTFFK